MSLLDEFIEASTPPGRRCGVTKLLEHLDDVAPDKAEALRAAIAARDRVTNSALEKVVKGWDIEDAPHVTYQTFQRHRLGACCRGD